MNKILIYSLICVSIIFSNCEKKEDIITQQESSKSFLLSTTDNKTIEVINKLDTWKIKDNKEKIILLNFFATWCSPCKAEIPHLNSLQNKYKDKLEIISILISDNKTNNDVKKFIKEHKIEYIVTNNNDGVNLSKKIGNVRSIPTMFLINNDGKISQKYLGIVPEEMLEHDIKKTLKL